MTTNQNHGASAPDENTVPVRSDDVERKPVDPQPCPNPLCTWAPTMETGDSDTGVWYWLACVCGVGGVAMASPYEAIAQWNMLSMTSEQAETTQRVRPTELASMQSRVAELAADIGPNERQAMLAELAYLYRCRDGLRAALTVLTEISCNPQTHAEKRSRQMAHDARRRIAWPQD